MTERSFRSSTGLEHEWREEIFQYVYDRYGRDRAALTAVAISYRSRSAISGVAKALGLPPDQASELSAILDSWSEASIRSGRSSAG